jgi:hypothetical protein
MDDIAALWACKQARFWCHGLTMPREAGLICYDSEICTLVMLASSAVLPW